MHQRPVATGRHGEIPPEISVMRLAARPQHVILVKTRRENALYVAEEECLD